MTPVNATEAPTAVTGTSTVPVEDEVDYKRHLARKLTCCAVTVIALGALLILLIQIVLTLTSLDDWEKDVRAAMLDLEKENLGKLAADKAEFVGEVFGRLEEGILQLQAFAEDALVLDAQRISLVEYLEDYPGIIQENRTWDNSVWYIPSITSKADFPEEGSQLESLLNRSGLMDIPFRSMQQQHDSIYITAIDSPYNLADDYDVNFQSYPGFNVTNAGYLSFEGEVCDERFTDLGDNYIPNVYDPRCRVWYQDAIESGTDEMVVTDPYVDAASKALTITPAAAVRDGTGGVVLGVIGIDMNFDQIEQSIIDFSVTDDEGYAFLLAAEDGTVAVHEELEALGGLQTIYDVERDLDEDNFEDVLANITEQCRGLTTYERDGELWIISWEHELVAGSSSAADLCVDGFVVGITVSEAAIYKVFDRTRDKIHNVVIFATIMMGVVIIFILCMTGGFAYTVSAGITRPVNQLVDIVRGLNRMDFEQQEPGSWMLNEVSSPEVDKLVDAFLGMTTILKSGNLTLSSGNMELAQKIYEDALILYKKLENDRGVSIVNNNLGNVYTLQAQELAAKAADAPNALVQGTMLDRADEKFEDAINCYKYAINDAEMLCSEANQHCQMLRDSSAYGDPAKGSGKRVKKARDIEAQRYDDLDDQASFRALDLQLMNRKFNIALCMAARGTCMNRGVPNTGYESVEGRSDDHDTPNQTENASTTEARNIMWTCERSAAKRDDALGDERRVEYLIAIAGLERELTGRQREAKYALSEADAVVRGYRSGDRNEGLSGNANESSAAGKGRKKSVKNTKKIIPVPTAPHGVLRQRLLVARAENSAAFGDPDSAVRLWDEAVVGCGDKMDINAVRKALMSLMEQAAVGRGTLFSAPLLRGLRMHAVEGTVAKTFSPAEYTAAIDVALKKLEQEMVTSVSSLPAAVRGVHSDNRTKVDLCFIMDCTGSMQRWIDQCRKKLNDIIDQAAQDVTNLELRVAFVGYRDIGDKRRFEGPFDFHNQNELPDLVEKLQGITATGGADLPEDIAGGLFHATQLSWESPIRLCILIGDAPCHGSVYHGVRDYYPKGCPNGRDPVQLLYTLQYELGVDFYFIRITTVTDKMINVFRNKLAKFQDARTENTAGKPGPRIRRATLRGTDNIEPKFIVHDLGDNDNRFLDAVVRSVKQSAGLNLSVETY